MEIRKEFCIHIATGTTWVPDRCGSDISFDRADTGTSKNSGGGLLHFSAVILFFAGRQIANYGIGIIWSITFSFSVAPFRAAAYFGTETTLYPAVAGCLYALTRWFGKGRPDTSNWLFSHYQ
jgi:hypothetical protein